MDTDKEAKEALLSEALDHFQGGEKTTLQRRRNRPSSSSNTNTLEQSGNLEHCASMAAKQQFSLNQVMIMLAIYLGGEPATKSRIEKQMESSMTCTSVFVVMISVGYGNLVPDTMLAKLLASAYVFTGMAVVGLILGRAADRLVEKQELLLVRAMHIMCEKDVGPAELLKEVETHKVKYKFSTSAVLLFLLIMVGTVCLYSVEDLRLMDAFYCVCSTITTLGYGDESFSTRVGRIFAVFLILGSTICLAQFFLYLAEFYTESRQRSLVKWILTRKLTTSDLEAADLDHDKVVSAAEFVLYKLK